MGSAVVFIGDHLVSIIVNGTKLVIDYTKLRVQHHEAKHTTSWPLETLGNITKGLAVWKTSGTLGRIWLGEQIGAGVRAA